MNKRTMAIARATGMIGATLALAVSVTFALPGLSSTASLTNNTVSSATVGLQVWNGSAYVLLGQGFTVTGLVPGHGSGPLPFYLKNSGDIPLALTVHVPTAPSAPVGFSGWNNLTVTLHNEAGGNDVVTDMQALMDGQVALPGNPLPAGAQGVAGATGTPGNYTANFDIVPSSITPGATQVTTGSFDLVFTGTQQ